VNDEMDANLGHRSWTLEFYCCDIRSKTWCSVPRRIVFKARAFEVWWFTMDELMI
jgi:hypothetical protein